jgi:hypothetical protein
LGGREGPGLPIARVFRDDEVEGVAHADDDQEVAPLRGRDEACLDELGERLVLLAEHDAAALVADAFCHEHLAAELAAQQGAERRRASVRCLEQEEADVPAEDGHRGSRRSRGSRS